MLLNLYKISPARRISMKLLNDTFKNIQGDLALDVGGQNAQKKSFINAKKYINLDIKKYKNVDCIGDAHYLPFKNDCFDILTCIAVAYMFREPQKPIKEFYRVLKKGGILVITFQFFQPLLTKDLDLYRYSIYNIRLLLDDFKNVKIIPMSGFFGLISYIIWFYIKKQKKMIKILMFPFILLSYLLLKLDKPDEVFSIGFIVIAEK